MAQGEGLQRRSYFYQDLASAAGLSTFVGWRTGKNAWRNPLHLAKSKIDFGDELPERSGTFRQRYGACQSLRRPRYLALKPIDWLD